MYKKILYNFKFLFKFILLAIITVSCIYKESNNENIPVYQPDSNIYGNYKVGDAYYIGNKKYLPREIKKYYETGIASWYGSQFNGKKTANGGIFDKFALTAAHKTLPLPSVIRITNLESKKNKSIIVVVNDRGPFIEDRLIDVSERAAELLDFKDKGITKVSIELLVGQTKKLLSDIENNDTTNSLNNSTMKTDISIKKEEKKFIQVGTYSFIKNAKRTAKKLEEFEDINIYPVNIDNRILYKVKIGPLKDKQIEKSLLEKVIAMGYFDALIITEKK